jgi:hypothetical protein
MQAMSVGGDDPMKATAAPSSRPHWFEMTDGQLLTLAGLIFGANVISLLVSRHVDATSVLSVVLAEFGLLVLLVLGFRVAWGLLFVRLLVLAFADAYAATRGHGVSGTALFLLDLAAIATLWRIWVPRIWAFV